MKKLMMVCVALVCATVLTGCGNPHEKVVKEMYLAVSSGDNDEMKKFAEANFAPGLEDVLKYNKDTNKVFQKLSESEGFAKTEVLKTFKKDGYKFSVISARCEGTTLYCVVGGKDGKIVLITTKRDEAMDDRKLDESAPRKAENAPKAQRVTVPPQKVSLKEETEMLLSQLRKHCEDKGCPGIMSSIESMLNMTDAKDRPKMLRETLRKLRVEPCVPESCREDAAEVPAAAPAKTSQAAKSTAPVSNTSDAAQRLTPEQKARRLMVQLKKVLGNSMEVSAALVALQAKVDQLPGDYKVKCVLQEMMGNSYRRSGIVPDLPDPNGNGALAEYLKARGIDDAGNIMCMYHMLNDKEQTAVAEEVRKLLK